MLETIMGVLGVIPGLSTLITFVVGKIYDAKIQLTTARIGGDVNVATSLVNAAVIGDQTRVAGLQVLASSKVMLAIVAGFALPWIIYEWKVVVWDNVLNLGSTAPIRGNVGEWAGTIITCIFGSGTIMSVGHMYFHRDKTGE